MNNHHSLILPEAAMGQGTTTSRYLVTIFVGIYREGVGKATCAIIEAQNNPINIKKI